MMDDLPGPVESALIVYDRFERVMRRPEMRAVAPLLGAVMLAGVATSGVSALAAGGTGVAAGIGWLVTAIVGVAVGMGLLPGRSATALVASYVLTPLQALALLGLNGSMGTAATGVGPPAWLALAVQGVLLGFIAVLVLRAEGRHAPPAERVRESSQSPKARRDTG